MSNEWDLGAAVGNEIIYDRYSLPGKELSRAAFMAKPHEALTDEQRVYIIPDEPTEGDWVVMKANEYYQLLANLEEAIRTGGRVTPPLSKEEIAQANAEIEAMLARSQAKRRR